MLVLSRKNGTSVRIGTEIILKVIEIKGGRVRLGIEAPKEVRVVRDDAKRKEAA